jgi:hypothetical protein
VVEPTTDVSEWLRKQIEKAKAQGIATACFETAAATE